MVDKAGYELEAGQMVDVYYAGMLTCRVAEVHDSGLIGGDGQMGQGGLVLEAILPVRIKLGANAPVYIIASAPEPTQEGKIIP